MSRTPEQRAAIDRRDRDIFLRAGAGTGKTGVLVDRYCAAVAEDGVTPEQILAFTFTERAAGELRRRVRSELVRRAGEAKGAGDTELMTRLDDSVRALGAAPITTIHGFCRRLLSAHPVAAGLDPRFRVLDASEATRVAWTAFDAALEDVIADDDGTAERVVAIYRVDRVRNLVRGVFEELRSRGDQPELPPPAPRDLGAAVQRMGEAARAAKGGGAALEACYAGARDLAERPGDRLPTFEELVALETESKSSVPERKACLDAISEAIAVAAEAGQGREVYDVFNRLLGRFAERYDEAKAERSGLDFEDLQIGAVALLRDSPGIGSSYRERFAHLLVDEFQDTNALQLKLIEQLRGPESRLFVVGDRFQAIYGFRHADIGVFNREEQRFAERPRAEVLSLTGNFRSRPAIIAAANATGAATMDDFAALSAARDDPEAGGGRVELLVTERGGWDDEEMGLERRSGDPMPAEAVAEARNVASRLRELADGGASAGDMVVLLRAFTHVDAFEEALNRVDLAPYVAGGGGYWSQQQTQDMICLLSAVANPLADEQMLGVLASPACGVSPDTLWLLRRALGKGRTIWRAVQAVAGGKEIEDPEDPDALTEITDSDRERLVRIHGVLHDLQRLGARLPLESLVEQAITESGYDLGVLGADHGPARFANVTKLMRLARDFERVEGRDLRGFLDFAALATAQDDEPPAAVEAEEGDGVKIMTTHSAKGLEFPIVAVAGLGRNTIRGGGADVVLGRAGEDPLRVGVRLARIGRGALKLFQYADLVDEATGREEAEELRLSYVALTRAREHLILSGVRTETDHKDPRAKSVLRRLLEHCGQEAPEDGAQVTFPAPPRIDGSTGESVDVRISVSSATPEECARLSQRRAPGEPPAPEAGRPPIVELAAPPPPVRALSYSTLHEHSRCGYRFYVERVVGLGESGAGGDDVGEGVRSRDHALHFGNAVHELLRWSAEHRWAAPGEAVIAGALARQGLSAAADVDRSRALVSGWLESELGREVASGTASLQPEHPFLIELAGTTVRGTIDLLVTRPGQPPLLVDYKTNRLTDRSAAEAAEDYETQRRLYALAAARGLGVDRIRVAYAFLEAPGEPVVSELGPEELAEAASSLEARISDIAAGTFEVTPNPTWPLCHDCPARSRLCPAPATPQRDEAQRVAA